MSILPFWLLYSGILTAALWHKGAHPAAAGTSAAPPGAPPRKILIVGASGGTGRQLVAQALERGYEVTAFVRNPDRFPKSDPRLRILQGDVLDYRTVEAAVKGQDAVISVLGHKRYFGPSTIFSDGTSNILQAMEAHGVRRFICATALGIGNSAGRLGLFYSLLIIPLVLPFYFWDKARQERLIAASRADWTIVRPGMLTNGPKRGECRHGPAVGSYLLSVRISRADSAAFMLDQLAEHRYLRAAPGICW